jgi:hypothetical protein
MNASIQFKTPILSLLIAAMVTLVCLRLAPLAQAVVLPPDGDYAGGNTAEGQNALLGLTTGTYNTAVGIYSLLSNATAKFNTGVGAGALLANSTTEQNTATGAGALLSHTTGNGNTGQWSVRTF